MIPSSFRAALLALLAAVPAGASAPARSPAKGRAGAPLRFSPLVDPRLPALSGSPVPFVTPAAAPEAGIEAVPVEAGARAIDQAQAALPSGDGPDARRRDQGRRSFDAGLVRSESGDVFAVELAPAASVSDSPLVVLRLARPVPAAARAPSAAALAASAEELLDEAGRRAAAGQRQLTYREAGDLLFQDVERVVVGGTAGMIDVYTGVFVPGTSRDTNIEHVFPQTFFRPRTPVSRLMDALADRFPFLDRRPEALLPMRSDLHHLQASLSRPNSERGSLPFGAVTGVPDYEESGSKRGGGLFEPADPVKGELARAMLYFFARYRREPFFQERRTVDFWNGQVRTLLRWHREFPVTDGERARNGRVERAQGNRNPFVDEPDLVDRIVDAGGEDAFRASRPARRVRR